MKKFFILLCTYGFSLIACSAQGTWVQMANLGGAARSGATGFSIGTKGYIGTGYVVVTPSTSAPTNDFWEWDQVTNVWTQKANFGGVAREYAIGFSIGNKGYIGTGQSDPYTIINCNHQDFWEYDPGTNIWTQKANLPGQGRNCAVGFSIGSKGYIATGAYQVTISSQNFLTDLWEYDPPTDTWTQKANFLGTPRQFDAGFSIGNKGYIGTGVDTNSFLKDFWAWDQPTNTWTQKADFAGGNRWMAVAYSIGSYGYMGMGDTLINGYPSYMNDFWRYNPYFNTWTQTPAFPAGTRIEPVGFSIGCKGYFGTGSDTANNLFSDYWKYIPDTLVASVSGNFNTHCGVHTTLYAFGGIHYLWSTGDTTSFISVAPHITTTYTVWVSDVCGSDTATVTINVSQMNHSLPSVTNVNCLGSNNGSASVNVSGGTPQYSYSWNSIPIQTTQTATGLYAGTYSVTVTDSLGCSFADTVAIISPTGLTSLSPVITNIDCFGNSNGIAAISAAGGTSPYSYSWNPTAQTSSTATGLVANVYTVTITDNNACIINTLVSVAQPTLLTASISSDISICSGTSATENLIASGGTPSYSYSWMPGGATTSVIIISPPATTTYTANITDAHGCSVSQLTTTITVVQYPAASVSYTTDLCGSGSVQFIDNATNTSVWSWNFGDGGTASAPNPAHIYSALGSYSVTLSMTGYLGCNTVNQLLVDVPPFSQLYLPNAFSPNDDGRDDIYYVFGKCIVEMTFTVYDRWGEKIFETTNPAVGWDGTYKGQMENAGVFMYSFNGTLTTGEKVNQKGNITLMR